jgi:hypothetical protein
MGFVPKGTGRYLMAQVAGVWLWLTFYFIWLLAASIVVAGFRMSAGRVVLAVLVFVNLCGVMLLRKIAHSGVAKHSAEERRKAVAVGEFCGEMAVALTDEDAMLYGMASHWKRTTKAIFLAVCFALMWFAYSVAGFATATMAQGLQQIAGHETASSQFAQLWEGSAALRIYVIAGALMLIHIYANIFVEPLRRKMDRFILGPYFETVEKLGRGSDGGGPAAAPA